MAWQYDILQGPLSSFNERHVSSTCEQVTTMTASATEDAREVLLREHHEVQDRSRSIHIAFNSVFSYIVHNEKRRDRDLSEHAKLLEWTEKKGAVIYGVGEDDEDVVMDDAEVGFDKPGDSRHQEEEDTGIDGNHEPEPQMDPDKGEELAIGPEIVDPSSAVVSKASTNLLPQNKRPTSNVKGRDGKGSSRKAREIPKKVISTINNSSSEENTSNKGLAGELKWLQTHAKSSGFGSSGDSHSTEAEGRASRLLRRTRTAKPSSTHTASSTRRTVSSASKAVTKPQRSIPYEVLHHKPGENQVLVNHYPELHRQFKLSLRNNKGRKRYSGGSRPIAAEAALGELDIDQFILQCAKARGRPMAKRTGTQDVLLGKVFLQRNVEKTKKDVWRRRKQNA